MLADETSPILYQVNVQAQRIERIDASTNSVEVVSSPGATVVAGDAIGSDMASIALPPPQPQSRMPGPLPPVEQMLDSVLARAGSVAPGLQAMVERSRDPAAHPTPQPSWPPPGERTPAEQPSLSQLDVDRSARTVQVAHSPGAIAVGGNVHHAAFATHVAVTPVGDLDRLMSILIEQDVAHHQQLNSYLAAVRDHLAGGPTTHEQAAGYWRWFADHAVATLSGVDGVLALVERIGTVFR